MDVSNLPPSATPGMYSVGNRVAVIPQRSTDGRAIIPFSWVSEFPPLLALIEMRPDFWYPDPKSEVWLGGELGRMDVIWLARSVYSS